MYLLDTNVISELRKQKPHGAVVAWIEAIEDKELYVSAVTLGEIQAGIEITALYEIEWVKRLSAGLEAGQILRKANATGERQA
jgi:predicted nucleic acid-binding protein